MADLQLKHSWRLDAQSAAALARGVHGDPFAVLGPHDVQEGRIIRCFLPSATKVDVLRRSDGSVLSKLEPEAERGLFETLVPERIPYRLRIHWPGTVQETEDPYSFSLLLGDLDILLFNEGRHFELVHCLGAQSLTIDGIPGVRFAVWAPNARRVAVVGDFNSWDRRRHPMRLRAGAGVWEIFVPRVAPGSRYKYDILGADGAQLPWKAVKFILPLSHDEVVYGKKSLIEKMSGDRLQQFANLRAYFGFMWGHPGKKLLFMGGEFAQEREWSHDADLDWGSLEDSAHAGIQRVVCDLNRLYASEPALHQRDCESSGFHWIVRDDAANSVFSFLRFATDQAAILVVCNMTPVPRHGYRIGVPLAGGWREIFNSDSGFYGGSNVGNEGRVETIPIAAHGQAYSVELILPPLATIYLRYGG